MTVSRFLKHTAEPGPFRDLIARYSQAHLLQVMQCTARNALHNLEQRCSRWRLQTAAGSHAVAFEMHQLCHERHHRVHDH
jgi:hypothetical protein